MTSSVTGLVELNHDHVPDAGCDEHEFVLAVPTNLPVFADHFAASPILPAYIQVSEVVARARRAWPDLGTWAGASAMKFQAPIRPGTSLVLRLRRCADRHRVEFWISAADTPCARGTLAFASLDTGPA